MLKRLSVVATLLIAAGLGALSLTGPTRAQSGLMPANTVQAGPTSGAEAFGNPRQLVAADLTVPGIAREKLTGNRTYFVNGSTGSDANNGLTSGSPFLTPAKAYATACNAIDLAGNTVLIDLSDAGAFTGTYSGANTLCEYVGYSSSSGQGTVVVRGASARSVTCVNYPTISGGITQVSAAHLPWTFKNLQINGQTTADAGAWIAFDGNCFGTTVGPHVGAVNGGFIEFVNNPYTINGAATGGHIQATFGGEVAYQTTVGTVTITGTPSMGGTFATMQYGGLLLCQDITFTGSVAASTKHYSIDATSSIFCGKTSVTGDPNAVLPGDTTGTGLGLNLQLLTSVGPASVPTYNYIGAFVQVTPPITSSGTGTITLGCASCVLLSGTSHGDSDYSILSTDRYVYINPAAVFTAPRTWTLPAANSVTSGTTIWIQDSAGTVTSTNTLTIKRAGSDTIDVGSTFLLITSAGGGITFTSDGVSNWGVPVQTVSTGGTGLKTLNPHSLLVGEGTNALTALGVGSSGMLLLGVTGADPGFATMSQDCTINTGGNVFCGNVVHVVKSQTFTSSGTYTPSTGLLYAIIECVGGGGGGGGITGSTGNTFSAGGGGAGSYSRKYASAATIGVSQTVTIGTAGAGGVAGSNSGAAGGDTSVGSLCVGKGGSGGVFSTAASIAPGTTGGVAGTGDFTPTGEPGVGGFGYASSTILFLNYASGMGGSSVFGGGAKGIVGNGSSIAGNNATNYGSGGGGAACQNSATNAAGGNGSAGVVIITEFTNQ